MSPEAKKIWDTQVHPELKSEVLEARERLHAPIYLQTPVGIQQFIEDDYYLGRVLRNNLFPRLKEDLIELFAGEYSEVLLIGSQGWGKSLMATVGICYDIYLVSCIEEPAAAFGMIPGSNITFYMASVRELQAKRVLFTSLYNLVKSCPYFHEQFPYESNLQNEIRFPQNVNCYPVAASEQALLGEGVFSAAFDEMNFMAVVEHSKLNPEGGGYDQAVSIYNRLSQRIRTRMNQRGRLPGHLWLISSARYPNDFTERKAREALMDERIFVREYATWETRPAGTYLPEKFKVEVGDVTRRTRVLDGTEEGVNQERILEVPMDFKAEFDKDPDNAVRNYGGVSILTIRPFIPRREKIQDMFVMAEKAGMKHPFSAFTVTLQDAREKLFPQFLHWVPSFDEYRKPILRDGKPVMMLAPGPYFAHIDLAKNQDAAGLVIGHVIDSVQIQMGVMEDMHFETKPIVRIDLALQIVAPKGGEIQIASARGILYRLRELGMQFGTVSYDGWQSVESVQTLNAEGFTALVYSVDKTTDAYEETKRALYDDRLLCVRNPILEKELGALRIDDKLRRIDHPTPHGSKDVSDGLAAVVHHAEEGYAGGATSQWKDVTTISGPAPATFGGFDTEDDELEWKLMNNIPMTAEEIQKIK